MYRRLLVPLLILLAQAMLVWGPAAAQNLVDPRGRDRDRGSERLEPVRGISLDEAVRAVERRYRARAVKAETVISGGRRVHEIRLLNADGKVWKVRVDAETGRSY
ncbi:MAG TPA: PepSY domain-containing protein [Steroidobacteraceae bacterium]